LIAAGVEKLASGGDRIVLLSVSPFSLTSEGCSNEHFKGERRRTREEIVEALYFGELMSFFEPLDPLELLSGKYQEALGAQLSETYYHEDYQPTGWVASWKKKWDTSHALQSYQDTFERTDLDADCVAGVLTTVRELAQRGYRVYGVRPPIHTQLLALEESFLRGRFEEIRRKLVDVGVVWLELPLTTTETYDGSHLTKEAAVEFSRQLGRSIR
jgi:hypothetical protein